MEEHSILVDGDVLVGNKTELGFGITAKMVVAGEHVKINGSIVSESDVRIDMWSEITGDIMAKADAYLGEFVRVNGKLAAGNLDVGNNVNISGGYDVKGMLTIRNPLPIMMFVLFYMMALLRLGGEEEVEKALEEMFSEDAPANKVMSIPGRTKINLEAIKTTSNAVIGNHCRLLGNIRARSAHMGNHVTLFGSIKTAGRVTAGTGCTIHGNIVSKENVNIGRNCSILGKISANSIVIHETAKVDGGLEALNGVTIEQDNLEGLDELERSLFYGFILLE